MKVRAHANTNVEGLVWDIVGNRIKESASDYLDGRCRRRRGRFLSAVLSSCKRLDAFVDTEFSDYGYTHTCRRARVYVHEQLPSDLCALSALTN